MKKHWLFTALLAILLAVFCVVQFPVEAEAASADALVYTLNSNGNSYTVTDFSVNATAYGALEIPATFNGKPVTGIGEKAFYASVHLTEIIIPDSVISIGKSAFEDCSDLTSITIPNGVTSISDSAFYGCSSLTSITIPDGVTSIGLQAFKDCSSLTTITIPDGVTSIGFSAFEGCKSLTGITIPEGITRILSATFKNCHSLTNVQIPDGATYIGDYAFSGSGITEITIPDGVTKIEYNAFYNCGNLTRVIGGEAVTSIGKEAFKNCVSLASVAIGKNVTSVGQEAFRNCISLTGISIGNSATSIGNSAFYGCSKLSGVTLGSSVTSIGNLAFKDCSSLTEIIIPDSVTSLGNSVFQGCSGLARVSIGKGVTKLLDYTFENCSSLTSITISGRLTNIGWHAFSGCSSLPGITIPAGVKEIGTHAFYNCEALASITIPSSVTTIGSYAFYDCGLTDVYYDGTTSQWPLISIASPKDVLENATIHCSNGIYVKSPEPSCPNGHQSDDGTVTKEATCTETGTKIYKCLRCKETIQTETLPALEHNYDKGTITKQPTCVEYGEALYTCQRCNETKTESMSKSKTHNYQAVVTKATLSKDGAVEEKCADCGKVKSSSVVVRPATFALHTTSYAYDGQAKKPVVTVQDANGNYLVKGVDYHVTYSGGCTDPGTYQVAITMTGNYSGSKTLTFEIKGKATVTTQPKTQKVAVGKTVKFTIKATGDGLKYQWQSSANGKTWKNCSSSSATKASFSFTGKTSHNGNYYRCKVTDSAGNVAYSDTARAYVLGVTTQPKTQKVEAGDDVKFTVKATGASLKYQWQSSTNGKTWKNCSSSSAKKASFSFTSKTSHSGNYYRCRITDSAGNVVYTDTVRLYVLGITEQPVSKTVTKGKTAKFPVEATGASKTYQWQVSTDGGKTWKNCSSSSAKKATFSFTAKTSHNGNYYRCRVKDSGGNTVYTNKVKLTVKK